MNSDGEFLEFIGRIPLKIAEKAVLHKLGLPTDGTWILESITYQRTMDGEVVIEARRYNND